MTATACMKLIHTLYIYDRSSSQVSLPTGEKISVHYPILGFANFMDYLQHINVCSNVLIFFISSSYRNDLVGLRLSEFPIVLSVISHSAYLSWVAHNNFPSITPLSCRKNRKDWRRVLLKKSKGYWFPIPTLIFSLNLFKSFQSSFLLCYPSPNPGQLFPRGLNFSHKNAIMRLEKPGVVFICIFWLVSWRFLLGKLTLAI